MAESVKDQTSVSGKGKTQHLVCFYSTSGPVQDNLHIPFIVMNVQYLVTKH